VRGLPICEPNEPPQLVISWRLDEALTTDGRLQIRVLGPRYEDSAEEIVVARQLKERSITGLDR
jgi:hypothetical protein